MCWISEKKVLLGEQDTFLLWADSGKGTMRDDSQNGWWRMAKVPNPVTGHSGFSFPHVYPWGPELLSHNTLAWFLPPLLSLGPISSEGTFQDSCPLLLLFSLSALHKGRHAELPPVQLDWSISLFLQANKVQFPRYDTVEPYSAIHSCLKSYRAKQRPISWLCASNMSSPSCGIRGQPGLRTAMLYYGLENLVE